MLRCASRIFMSILNTRDELGKCDYLCLQAGKQDCQAIAKFTSAFIVYCPVNSWSPSHLDLLPGWDHVAAPHPLIFPGFPFMKTGVLSGKVDMYPVLALVWIWDRIRVQTWIWEHGSSPGPSACSFLSGWGEQWAWQKLTFLSAWSGWCRSRSSCGSMKKLVVVGVFGKDSVIGEHHRDSAVGTHWHQGHRDRQRVGETGKNETS